MLLRASILAGICVALTLGAPNVSAQTNPVVVMETSLGNITIELLQEDAPISVENFLAYINDGFYEGTVFHRVIPGFMIQGGGMTPDLTPKATRPPIQNEARNGVTNARGTVSMARTNVIDSGTSQFFISVADNARTPRPSEPGRRGIRLCRIRTGDRGNGYRRQDRLGAHPESRSA